MLLRQVVSFSLTILFFLPGQPLLGEPPQPPAPVRTDPYGDPLPKQARFRLGTLRLRYDGRVRRLAWSPDGRILASCGEPTGLRLWQIPGGKQLIEQQARWDNMEGQFCSLAPDGRTWTWQDSNEALHVVDLASGKELRRIEPGHCPGLLSPDGKYSVALEENGLRLYAVDTGKKLHFLAASLRASDTDPTFLFAPDSRSLIVNTENGICCWNLITGEKHHKLGKERPDLFAIAPNGKTLAGGDSNLNIITVWSWPEGKRLRQFVVGNEEGPVSLAFSADGKLLAAGGGEGTVRVWNLANGKLLRRIKALDDSVLALAFSPDGTLIATAWGGGRVLVWEVEEAKPPRPLTGVRHLLSLIGLSVDGKAVLTRSAGGALTVWNARDGCRLRTLHQNESAEHFLFGPEAGRTRALLEREVASGQHPLAIAKERIRIMACAPACALLAVGTDEGVLLLRKTAGIIEKRFLLDGENTSARNESSFSVRALGFSPDGQTLAVRFGDGRLCLWDTRTSRLRYSPALPYVDMPNDSCLAFSSDSRLLALAEGHEVQLIELAGGKYFRHIRLDHGLISSLTFAPDNRTLAIGTWSSEKDNRIAAPAIELWDLLTEKRIDALYGHDESIRTLILSPDCSLLYSGSDDYTVLCWDVATVMRRRAPSKELSTAKLTELWADLAAKDSARGQRAVAALVQAPDAALPILEKNLPPLSPTKTASIPTLIADLDHAGFVRREKASRELDKIGVTAAPALRKTLREKPSLEMRRRIEMLLEAIESRPLSAQKLRTLRAVQVLETIATPAARRILEGLAHGAAKAQQTQEAQSALQRLQRRLTKP